jgi:hypothetical protein
VNYTMKISFMNGDFQELETGWWQYHPAGMLLLDMATNEFGETVKGLAIPLHQIKAIKWERK